MTPNTKLSRKDLALQWCKKNNVARGVIIGLLGANIATGYFNMELENSNNELNQEISTLTSEHFVLDKKLAADGVHVIHGTSFSNSNTNDGYKWLESIRDQEIAAANKLRKGETK
ncbi:MAG TPA: hypothetical protein VM577_09385 [Anaerovoracaceae bacterium]|nr:hypothetical protein [Anaerovoracaceae bacterium]